MSSLLDDARQLAQPGIGLYCDACTGSPESGHFPGCPMLSLPKIVAVLEVVERLRCSGAGEVWHDPGYRRCISCFDFYDGDEYPPGEPPRHVVKPHATDCDWQALVAALNGEVVPTT